MVLIPTTGEYRRLFGFKYRSDLLPRQTAIDTFNVGANFLFNIDKAISLPVNLPDSTELYSNEKSNNVDRIGVPRKMIVNGEEKIVFEPFYLKPYSSAFRLYDKMVSSSILGMHAVPHEPYGVIRNGTLGVATMDLTCLRNSETKKPIKSIRFDILLNKLGHSSDVLTFYDWQNLLKNPNLSKVIDRRAFIQLSNGNFFLANGFGEVDPNSRNMILLENQNAEPMDETLARELFGDAYDPENPPRKLGFGVRIDVDENTHDNTLNRERSGKRIVCRSILFPNESIDTSLKLSQDDKHLLLEYSQNPDFVLKGSFIPPDGMTEEEYISQIDNDNERLEKARQIFKAQILEESPDLIDKQYALNEAIEQKMEQFNCYAKKKSFYALIEEANPNIDWALFNELFSNANRCVNETVIKFPADSMFSRQQCTTQVASTKSYLLNHEIYKDFANNTINRINTMFGDIGKKLNEFPYRSSSLESLDEPAELDYKVEVQPVDRNGVPILENSDQKVKPL